MAAVPVEPVHRIEITRTGHVTAINVDGVVIPSHWFANGSVVVRVDGGEVPSVTLTLIGETVVVNNSIRASIGATDGG